MKPAYLCGFDIGSISINAVALDETCHVVLDRYIPHHGKPFETLLSVFEELEEQLGPERLGRLSFTGTGGKLAAELLKGSFVNEIVAQSTAVSHFHPEVKTVIEMGGEDSKLIFMDEGEGGASRLSDFEMNTLCAAGTGSFLDQQARRIGISIEEEFGNLALQSADPPASPVAAACSPKAT
ncbi:MAG: BadF/BadG/BcrA/BcrD ATPase family protein [Bacteroidales bacterium]